MSFQSVTALLLLCVCIFFLDFGSFRVFAKVSTGVNRCPLIPERVKHLDFNVMAITTRLQYLQKTGRFRWAVEEKTEFWTPQEIGMIVVDMWDQHWCPSATERVQSLGIFINSTLNVARQLGVQIIHAPSETDEYYVNHPSRLWTLALPNVSLPDPIPHDSPDLPIDSTGGGCDVPGAYEHRVWTKETDLITIHPEDALIEDSDNGQTLWNLIVYRGLKHLVYVGVHENLCFMSRTFAIKAATSWGMDIAVAREATDTMYNPQQPPYCTHEISVDLMTQYIEKFWGQSLSVYDFLNPRNQTSL